MDLRELQTELEKRGIRDDSYSIGVDRDEAFVISDEGNGSWCVFYAERGARSNLSRFTSESAACAEILGRLERSLTAQTIPGETNGRVHASSHARRFGILRGLLGWFR